MLGQSYIERAVEKAGQKGIRVLKKQLRSKRAGNRMPMNTSLSLSNSLKSTVEPFRSKYTLKIKGNDYGSILDDGYETPFSGIRNTAGNNDYDSQYIEGLILWGMNKFQWSFKQAKKKAFAIAISHLNKGKNSPSASGWIKEVKIRVDNEISRDLQLNVMTAVNNEVNKVLNRKITTKL